MKTEGYQATPIVEGIALNLGCGFTKRKGMVNVDKFDICKPDVVLDLSTKPWPWEDNSVDQIQAYHVFEHIDDWWSAFEECARILKFGAQLILEVPHDSSCSSLSYRDHKHEFSWFSFYGADVDDCLGYHQAGTNAWAKTQEDCVPLKMTGFVLIPLPQYFWMTRWGFRWLMKFCEHHMNNFMHAQRFTFTKMVRPDRGKYERD